MAENKAFNIDEFKLNQNLFIEASAGTGKTFTIRKIVAKLVKEKFGYETFLINYVGATIGAHSGPGTIALFFWGDHR